MNQAVLELDTAAAGSAAVCDPTGFELGWDHARHGLVPAAEWLLDGAVVGQGWRAGRAMFRGRTLLPTRWVRQWLALRTSALQRGVPFDPAQLTPADLAQIDASHCPVTRQPLGGMAGSADAPVVQRLADAAGYTLGNVAIVSQRAASAKAALGDSAAAALRQARRIDAGIDAAGNVLTPDEHWRLAVLTSFATALPFVEAARVPLRALPPQRVVPVNAVQRLQTLVTRQFSTPGWSTRVRALANLLPAVKDGRALRQDFNLFVGALAPRLIEAAAGRDVRAVQRALEDAWADERVNRRWQQFVLALGEGGVDTLLARAVAGAAAAAPGAPLLPRKPSAPQPVQLTAGERRLAGRAAVGDRARPAARNAMPSATPVRSAAPQLSVL